MPKRSVTETETEGTSEPFAKAKPNSSRRLVVEDPEMGEFEDEFEDEVESDEDVVDAAAEDPDGM